MQKWLALWGNQPRPLEPRKERVDYAVRKDPIPKAAASQIKAPPVKKKPQATVGELTGANRYTARSHYIANDIHRNKAMQPYKRFGRTRPAVTAPQILARNLIYDQLAHDMRHRWDDALFQVLMTTTTTTLRINQILA